jgi:hypothetical protein
MWSFVKYITTGLRVLSSHSQLPYNNLILESIVLLWLTYLFRDLGLVVCTLPTPVANHQEIQWIHFFFSGLVPWKLEVSCVPRNYTSQAEPNQDSCNRLCGKSPSPSIFLHIFLKSHFFISSLHAIYVARKQKLHTFTRDWTKCLIFVPFLLTILGLTITIIIR